MFVTVTSKEPTFSVNHRETIEATLVFSPNMKSISCSLTTTSPTSINQCEFLGNQVTSGFHASAKSVSTSASSGQNAFRPIAFTLMMMKGKQKKHPNIMTLTAYSRLGISCWLSALAP